MVKISFTGDVMCEYTRLADYYRRQTGEYDFTDAFKGIKKILGNSDYSVVNLETPLAGKELKYSWKDYQFNTPDEIADAMVDAGVNMAVTANNHVLDRGIKGLVRTLDVLDSRGIEHTGTFRSKEENTPLIKAMNGIRVAFLAYTYGTEACYNGNYLKKDDFFLVNLTRNQELSNDIIRFLLRSKAVIAKGFRYIYKHVDPNGFKKPVEERKESEKRQLDHLREDLNYCKKNADFTIMCLHCGGQFNEGPTDYTKRISALCIENGADAVICNHEHLIQGCKYYKDGKIITYCLGNLTSNYGIDRKPFDKNAECSIIFHIKLKQHNDKLEPVYSFTVVSSVRNSDGKIGTVTMKERYETAETDEQRKRIYSINLECINKFLGVNLKEIDLLEEYEFESIIHGMRG